jgi:TfoX/Sxy family transcriptional regulator of competence genes
MARDPGLEQLVQSSLASVAAITEKGMFGGWAFLLNGHLLCGCRKHSLMVRVGAENESWALEIAGVVPVVMRGRLMKGYVRAAPEAYGDDRVRRRLLDAAVHLTQALPVKQWPVK